jgi:hypothetical protein
VIEAVQWIAADVVIPIGGIDQPIPNAQVATIGGLQTLQVLHRPFKGTQGLLKVAEDYLVGGVALLIAAPLMLLVALAIRLDSPGPALFRQARTGFNNQTFMIFKFRTMLVDPSDDGSVGTTRPDHPRITRVGGLLRRLSIDELPQLINLLPGINYSTDDPTGLLSSDFRMHGFDGNHVSFTVDGTPVNDTGNYAAYPGEYISGENTERVTVNIGQSEIDSPTASAIGGTINIVTKLPPTTMGFLASAQGGSSNYYRGFAEFDTGLIGPYDTRAYLSVNYTNSDKTRGLGSLNRRGVEGRVYQPLRDKDFVSVTATYTQERLYFYESSSLAQIAQFGRAIDYNTQWAIPTAIGGSADAVAGPSVNTAPGFELRITLESFAPTPTHPGHLTVAAAAAACCSWNSGEAYWLASF